MSDDPIKADFDTAPSDAAAQQVIAAALARLDELVKTTVENNKVGNELMQVALALVAPTLRLLRYDLHMFENSTPEQRARVAKASEVAGDLAIARAVIAAPKSSDSREA